MSLVEFSNSLEKGVFLQSFYFFILFCCTHISFSELNWGIEIWYVDLVGILNMSFEDLSYSFQYILVFPPLAKKIHCGALICLVLKVNNLRISFILRKSCLKYNAVRCLFFFLYLRSMKKFQFSLNSWENVGPKNSLSIALKTDKYLQ